MENSLIIYEHPPVQTEETIIAEQISPETIDNLNSTEECVVEISEDASTNIEETQTLEGAGKLNESEVIVQEDTTSTEAELLEETPVEPEQKPEEIEQKTDDPIQDANIQVEAEDVEMVEEKQEEISLADVTIEEIPIIEESSDKMEYVVESEEVLEDTVEDKEIATEVIIETIAVEQLDEVGGTETENQKECMTQIMIVEEIPESVIVDKSDELKENHEVTIIVDDPDKTEENEMEECVIVEEVTEDTVAEENTIEENERVDSAKCENVAEENVTENETVEMVEGAPEINKAESEQEMTHIEIKSDYTIAADEQELEKPNQPDQLDQLDKHDSKESETAETVDKVGKEETVEKNASKNSVARTPIERSQRMRSGRQSKVFKDGEELYIPCHVMGRNVDNPTEDMVSNGRTPPKPRLGVKVPYRNLTSQIVTKQDIANELLERAAKRNPNPDPPLGGDIFFCKKLTSNLASKIALRSDVLKIRVPERPVPEVNAPAPAAPVEPVPEPAAVPDVPSRPANIHDNSDLLDILEGNVDVDWTTEVRQKAADKGKAEQADLSPPVLTPVEGPTVNANANNTPPKLESLTTPPAASKKVLDPELEKELALKQLKELPKKMSRRSKHAHSAVFRPAERPVPEKSQPAAAAESADTKAADRPDKSPLSDDLILTTLSKRVTKTYSRKDPVVEVPADLAKIVIEADLAESAKDDKKGSAQKRVISQELTLTSKRARVIKKKVIWDPDEFPKARQPVSRRPEPPRAADKSAPAVAAPPPVTAAASTAPASRVKRAKPVSKVKSRIMTRKKLMERNKRLQLDVLKKVAAGGVKKPAGKLVKKKVLKSVLKKIKPKMTELDRLLMDEGAINLLCERSVHAAKAGRASTISLDKAQRDLLSRIKAVKNVICSSTLADSPKALRRKDSPTGSVAAPPRKKSRDSVRSSIQSPPPSPSYMFPQRAEASRIIRRHSSSFSSECSSPRRLSLDQQAAEARPEPRPDDRRDAPAQPTTPRLSRKRGVPIFVRQNEQKTYKGKVRPAEVKKEKLTVADKRRLNEEMQKNFSSAATPRKITRNTKAPENGQVAAAAASAASPAPAAPKPSPKAATKPAQKKVEPKTRPESSKYKEISLRKIDNLVQIILTPTSSKIKNAFNLQTFKELSEVLAQLSKDDGCRVVLITSTDSCFCHGVDFSLLLQANADKRTKVAQDMSRAVKEFLHGLAGFPKPLVAGVQGSAVGLGVTMLPLFDIVLASDKATFSTPYGRLGQVPEGATLLTLPHLFGNALTSELFFACRKLTASEALSHGLVTKILWPDKFHEELIPIAKSIANQSKQCLEATKALLRHSLNEKLKEALDTEHKLLVQHWTSAECQQNFRKLLQESEWW